MILHISTQKIQSYIMSVLCPHVNLWQTINTKEKPEVDSVRLDLHRQPGKFNINSLVKTLDLFSIMNNSTITEEDCTFDACYTEQALIFVPEVQTGFLVLYGIVSLVGTIGNLFILITVIRNVTIKAARFIHACYE